MVPSKPSDVLLQRNKHIQEEILNILNEPVSRPTDILKHEVSKRCQALASFMESLLDEVTCPDLKLDLPQESEITASERDSVMLGEISPHHDYCDSKSSSETPPSYTQLNYNDNLLRFFNSHPKTLNSNDDLNKLDGSVELSPNQRFDESGDSRSAEDYSMGSYQARGCVSKNAISPNATPKLTEATLDRHNDDMEKGMVKKHKELRCSVRNFKGDKLKKQVIEVQFKDNHNEEVYLGHGVKRSGSLSWEADLLQHHKHQHISDNNNSTANVQPTTHNPRFVSDLNNLSGRFPRLQTPELWPPFSLSFPICATQTHSTHSPINHELSMTNILPGLHSGVFLYPKTTFGPSPLELQCITPAIPEPYYNGYIPEPSNSNLITQSIESIPNPSMTGELQPGTQPTTSKPNISSESSASKYSFLVIDSKEGEPSGVSF